MVFLPDNIKIEMQWKQVAYIKGNNQIIFEIIPMMNGKDIVIFPNISSWSSKQNIFSCEEREEIIFLLERIAWKRDIAIIEMDVPPHVNKKIEINPGMIESTEGYTRLARENLFDADSKLNKNQVKEILITGEDLSDLERDLKGVFAIVDMVTIGGAVAVSCKGNKLLFEGEGFSRELILDDVEVEKIGGND